MNETRTLAEFAARLRYEDLRAGGRRSGLPTYGLIEPADLARMRPELEAGDILVIDTGATAKVGTPDCDRHPKEATA